MSNGITNFLLSAFLSSVDSTGKSEGTDLSRDRRVLTRMGTSQERVSNWRSNSEQLRIVFSPCNSYGFPIAQPDGDAALNRADKIMAQATDVIGSFMHGGSGWTGFLLSSMARNYLVTDGYVGNRQTVTLFSNPESFKAKWGRSHPVSDSKDAATKVREESGAEVGMQAKPGVNWGAPTGTISLDGYCRNMPEIQIPILKYVFGMTDPWRLDVRLAQYAIEGDGFWASIAGSPPTKLALFLWEMWFPYLAVSPGSDPMVKKTTRYLGFVNKFEYTQSISESESQIDFKWNMEFTVLQKRDYSTIGP